MKTIDEPLMKLAVAYYYYSCTQSFDEVSVDDNRFGKTINSFGTYLAVNKDSFGMGNNGSNAITEGALKIINKSGELIGKSGKLLGIRFKQRNENGNSNGFSTSVSFSEDALSMIKTVNDEGIESALFREGELEAHPKKELIKKFYGILPKLIENQKDNLGLYDSGYHFGICFAEGDLAFFRTMYNLGINEIVLYMSENVSTGLMGSWRLSEGVIVTDSGLHYKDHKGGKALFLRWNGFDRVDYKQYYFYFYKNKQLIAELGRDLLFNNSDTNECIKFAEDLTSIAAVPNPIELAENGFYEEAIRDAESIIDSGEDVPFGHFAKATVMFMIERDKKGKDYTNEKSNEIHDNLEIVLKEYRNAIKEKESTNDSDKQEFVAHAMLCIADAESFMGRYNVSRIHYIEGLENCNEEDKDRGMKHLIDVEKSLQERWDKYTSELKYKDRKFIMPIRDSEIGGCVVDGITVFRMSNIPSCMKFPMGHPVANQLYIGHPFNPSLYVPYEDSEEMFFLDKVHELRYLLECLGAEEITITSIKGKEITEFSDNNNSYAVDVGIKRFSADVEIDTQNKNQKDSSLHSHRSMTVKLDPMQKPFLPEGLVWYNEMPKWQRLVQSRLYGNMLEYNEFVSTSETKFTSSSEAIGVKASAKFLWAKAHAEVNECLEKQFKESTETQWKVDVKFRSMKDFENEVIETVEIVEAKPLNQIGLSKEELEYAEEVKFCLEDDGIIDDSERRLLERKRIKFGISQKRAAEIEKNLLWSQLTEDEREYLEAVKEELVGGKIPEASRRLLERLRKRMDVSDERAKEIEIMAMKR